MLFFSVLSFANSCWCLLCLRDPDCSGVDIAVFVVWARFCFWMWSIIIRQDCRARRPWEEVGIVPQMGAPPPRGPSSSLTWNHSVLRKQSHILSWKGRFKATSLSSLFVPLSCGWHSNLAVISANIRQLPWQTAWRPLFGQLLSWQMRLCLALCAYQIPIKETLALFVTSALWTLSWFGRVESNCKPPAYACSAALEFSLFNGRR